MQLVSCTEAASDLIADRQPFSRNPVRDCDQHTPHQGHGGLGGGGCFVSTVFPAFVGGNLSSKSGRGFACAQHKHLGKSCMACRNSLKPSKFNC